MKELLGTELLLIPYHNDGNFSAVVKSMAEGIKNTKEILTDDRRKQGKRVTSKWMLEELVSTLTINWGITAMAAFALELETKETKQKSREVLEKAKEALGGFREASDNRIKLLEQALDLAQKKTQKRTHPELT